MEVLALAITLGIVLAKYHAAKEERDRHRKARFRDIAKFVNASVDPCTNFYGYACGNWEERHPNAEDEFDLAEKSVVDVTTDWLKWTPLPDPSQERSSDKAWSAIQLCFSVYQDHKEDLDVAKEYLSDIGLTTGNVSNVSLVDLLVNLSLRHSLPVTVTIQPKYDLRSSRKNVTDMVLTVSSGGPAFYNWFRVSSEAFLK